MITLVKKLFGGKQALQIAISHGDDRYYSFFDRISQEFEKHHSGVEVNIYSSPDAEYKKDIESWMQNQGGPDVLVWQGGERLYRFVDKKSVSCLNDFWSRNKLERCFSDAALRFALVGKDIYALPLYFYHWAFYYRKSIFSHLGLEKPKTWEDFLHVCSKLKYAGMAPIAIGAQDAWSCASWFDYFNLRINGLGFHKSLLQGEESYDSDCLENVFYRWKELVELEYFNSDAAKLDWKSALNKIFSNTAGMTLIGNFATTFVPRYASDDIDFFQFPVIDEKVPIYEEFPTDVALIPMYSQNKALAEKYLVHLSSASVQERFNSELGMNSPHLFTELEKDPFSKKIRELWVSSAGHTQFFDRDTNKRMADTAVKLFADFLKSPDISKTLSALETARLSTQESQE